MKKMIVWALSALLLCACAQPAEGSTSSGQDPRDGTYTYVNPGYKGDITLTIEVKGGSISAIKAAGPNETGTVGGQAINWFNNGKLGVLRGAVAGGDLWINGYSGATETTQGIKAGLEQFTEEMRAKLEEAEEKE